MQYDVKTPGEYMDALEDDWRKTAVAELRQLVSNYAPELTESIKYRMLSYDDAAGGVFGLNAQKNYVSFYVGDAARIDPDGSLLAGLNLGKGCIRFRKTQPVSSTRIEVFIARTMEMRRAGLDIGC